MLDAASERSLPVVLLIDDDLVSREVLATLLTLSGYTVHTAEGGEEALRMLAEEVCRPSVILVDVQMPGLSGADLIRELRTVCMDVRIYAISGSKPPDAVVSAVEGVLLKPFDASAVAKAIEGAGAPRKTYLAPDEPVVSVAVLTKLREMMPEKAVREIYALVVHDLEQRIGALGAAMARHDGEAVRRIGHAIKGGCGMAGALQAARLGALLEAETLERDNHLDNSQALLADLRAATRELQRMLDGELPA